MGGKKTNAISNMRNWRKPNEWPLAWQMSIHLVTSNSHMGIYIANYLFFLGRRKDRSWAYTDSLLELVDVWLFAMTQVDPEAGFL